LAVSCFDFFSKTVFFLAVDVPTKYSAAFKKSALIKIVAVVLEADLVY